MLVVASFDITRCTTRTITSKTRKVVRGSGPGAVTRTLLRVGRAKVYSSHFLGTRSSFLQLGSRGGGSLSPHRVRVISQ